MKRKRLSTFFIMVISVLIVSFGFFTLFGDEPTTAVSFSSISSVEPTPTSDLLGSWTAGANITSPGSNGGAGVGYSRNDTCWLYALNGDVNGSTLAPGQLRRYNITTNTWADMSTNTGRAWTSMTKAGPVSNTKLYNLGGLPSGASAWSSMTGTLQCYTINTNTWATLTSAPTPCGSSGLSSYQDSLIYAVGGMGTTGQPITNVQLYNITANSWRAATSLPVARANGWMVIKGDTIYYGCGAGPTTSTFNNTIYVGVISQTNRATITWTTSAVSFPLALHRMDAAEFGCYGVIIGPGGNAWWGMGTSCYTWQGGNSPFVSVGPTLTTSDAMVGSASFQRGSYRVWKFVIASGLILSAPYHILSTQIYTDSCLASAPSGWTPQVSSLTTSLTTVSAVNQNVGWIGGNGGVVLRTTNGGTNWTNVTGSPIGTADVYAICGIDANTCLVSTSPAATYVYRTSNGGANWTQVFTQTGGFIDDIRFMNATTGFMYGDPVGARWSLWKSTNGGVTWDSTGLYLPQAGSEAGWNNAMWRSGTNLWFGTNNTRVYKSTNFGSNWTFGATTGSVNTYSVAFNGNKGFTGQTVALTSTDAGTSWAAATLLGTGTIYSFNGVLDRFWYCRATRIFWSNDNGVTFDTQYVGTGTYQAMNLVQDGNIIRGWAVTSNGAIAAYYELISGISNNQNEIPDNYILSQNYPNPFNPSTKISFSLPKASDVKLVVYDIMGREVATLVNGFKQAGTHNIEFNASSLSSGVYFYRLESGTFTGTKKMLLVK